MTSPDPDHAATVRALDARRAEVRAAIAASPLGRYTAGRAAAERTAERAVEVDAVRWAVRVGGLLRALADGDEDRAAAELALLPADDVTELQTAGETLAVLCGRVAAGRRR